MDLTSVTIKAHAKINLALDILGHRPDGYHELRMVMQTLDLHDTLVIHKTEAGSFLLISDDDSLPVDERNLVFQAAKHLIREYNIADGISVSLQKRIPAAAGLAGGSSDCAAVIKGINRLFNLGIPETRMIEIGRMFGADVPFCLMEGTALAEGTGEILTMLQPHPPVWVVLARPGFAVSTREIFHLYDKASGNIKHPDISAMREAFAAGDIVKIAAYFGNVLASVTGHMYPVIYQLIEALQKLGAINAAMSGSGPTVFAYFAEKDAALNTMQAIPRAFPEVRNLFLTEVYNQSKGRIE